MTDLHSFWLILVVALVTAGLRFLPFVIFGENRSTPPLIAHLGQVLPYAIMGMLVVYCLKDVDLGGGSYGIPEFLSCAVVAGLHVWKRNTLLSIGAGTIFYMMMVQYLF